MTHLDTLRLHLSHERARLAAAKSDKERAIRQVWADQLAREVAAEERFIGAAPCRADDMTDDDLPAELLG
jgi:hypothetical protein